MTSHDRSYHWHNAWHCFFQPYKMLTIFFVSLKWNFGIYTFTIRQTPIVHSLRRNIKKVDSVVQYFIEWSLKYLSIDPFRFSTKNVCRKRTFQTDAAHSPFMIKPLIVERRQVVFSLYFSPPSFVSCIWNVLFFRYHSFSSFNMALCAPLCEFRLFD